VAGNNHSIHGDRTGKRKPLRTERSITLIKHRPRTVPTCEADILADEARAGAVLADRRLAAGETVGPLHYRVLQLQSRLKINFCEIFGVVRFSTLQKYRHL
jgi:hypothetical protein